MPHHPSNIRSAPEDVALTDIEETRQVVSRPHHVSAMYVHNTFWLASRTRCIQQEQRIFRVHFLRRTMRRKLQQIVVINLARASHPSSTSRINHHLLNALQIVEQ